MIPEEVVEVLQWSVLIVVLLVLLNILHSLGVFDPVAIKQCRIPTMLVATSSAHGTLPQITPLMAKVALMASLRGVEEETPEEQDGPARGQLVGEFAGALRRKAQIGPSEHGVVLEVGSVRVTKEAQKAWGSRLSSDPSVQVRILKARQVTIATVPERNSRIAIIVARWRILRRLGRRTRTNYNGSTDVMLLVSPKKRRLSMIIDV